ncbi:HTR-like protein [Halobacteriales archaeon QS_5_68_33]|nr:MAG: HTR-like protein [Halobacteriales archaeon QS_5_68_33]
MARSAKKAESLAEESQSMAAAMSRVLEVADGKGVVTWGDVSDDISSGEWGRLIEQGILVDVDGDGFVVDDPEGVREAIGESEPDTGTTTTSASGDETDEDGDEDEDEGWSKWDKMAAGGTVLLFLGYSQAPIRNTIGGVIDIFLGPLASVLPFYVMILVLAIFTSLNSAILQGKLMNMDKMGEYQERMQEIKERREAAKERGDDEALDEIQQEQMEAMGDQLGMFKQQFRPMVWIMLVNIPVFLWIYYMVQTNAMTVPPGVDHVMVLPLFGEISSWNNRIGPMWSWIIWYFVCSMSFSQIVRKALDVQTTPDTSTSSDSGSGSGSASAS